MTISSEISKLQTNLSNAYSAAEAKGATLPASQNFDNLSTTINSINVETITVDQTYDSTSTNAQSGTAVAEAVSSKQDTLVSGNNIKTINGNSLLGSGDIAIETNTDDETISYNSSDALQTIAVKNVRDNSTLPIWHGTEYQWNHGVSTTWYYWQTNVTVAAWTATTMPSSAYWRTVTYGDGKFVVIAFDSTKAAYSTDGINWAESTLPSSTYWSSVTYGDGKFVVVPNSSNKTAYSTDGINWVESTLPSKADWASVTYGDGKFVAVTVNSGKAAYSTDGINWTETTMPSSAYWISVTYGDDKFVTVAGNNSNKTAYSTDGINWTETTLPSSGYRWSVTYGDGKFVAVASSNSNKAAYSTDGINWVESTLPSSANWADVAYGDDKFVTVASGYDSDKSAIFSMTYDRCYTDTANPTTTSVVYSAPETVSSYTISSVTSGAITLSNNNTYYYNQSGNQYTYQTIGDAYPEYLCFIDGVGVKIGNTMIATNNSNNS